MGNSTATVVGLVIAALEKASDDLRSEGQCVDEKHARVYDLARNVIENLSDAMLSVYEVERKD